MKIDKDNKTVTLNVNEFSALIIAIDLAGSISGDPTHTLNLCNAIKGVDLGVYHTQHPDSFKLED